MAQKALFEEIVSNINPSNRVTVTAKYEQGFCPHIQFIRMEYLKKEELPYGYAENGQYLQFTVDLENKSIWLHISGHVDLNKRDRQSEVYKCYAKRNIVSIAKEYGVPKFRKSRFKTGKDIAKKIGDYYDKVMNIKKQYEQE